MQRIKLTQGRFALVDDEDFDYLNQWNWAYCSQGYARTHPNVYMHRLVLNTPDSMQTDHIDGNKLNNQKSNLRSCTPNQNQLNSKLRKDNTSGYKGVRWHKPSAKWLAAIKIDGKMTHLGSFILKEDAARKYQEVALSLSGLKEHYNYE